MQTASPHLLSRRVFLPAPAAEAPQPWLHPSERSALGANPWFVSLTASVRHDLLRHARVRRHAAGDVIAAAGEPVEELLACASGCVQLESSTPGGRQRIASYLPAGHWLADPGLFDGGAILYDATAHGATTTLTIDLASLHALLRQHPELAAALLRLQAAQLRRAARQLASSCHASVRERLVEELANLARTHGVVPVGEGWEAIRIQLQQIHLARLVGAARQGVNRELKAMEREGQIRLHRGAILLREAAGRRTAPVAPSPGSARPSAPC